MTYVVDNLGISALIAEEVSRVAAAAYADDGTSLYDSVAIHSRDTDTLSRLIDDAVSGIARRAADICTVIPSPLALSFYVPDFDDSKETIVENALSRSISLIACAAWMRDKLPSRAAEFTDRANASLNVAIGLLKTRITPTRL